ncbi:hypothetical protein CF83_gp50 [Enterococcus phage IME_EF3]|uniref:Uncharacterized protein n=1 Tax=Enterococcus phage IME_EF3 TaxID=1416012 RepID=V5US60_9CAUD|nr:hypothetical protein CF83_gp50 [Enterococcus phage IME_EF3]AHB79767.1 hypothetical protein [Enterococcus phage IME_EF3]
MFNKLGITLFAISAMGTSIIIGYEADKAKENTQLKEEVKLYKELNERQQDIIFEYKVVSGIEVSSITKTLDNKELIKQLDEKIKKLEEK